MFNEDLTPFFNAAEFASDALLDGVGVTGLFEKQYVSAAAGMGFSSAQPAMIVPAAVASAAPVGKVLFHGVQTYRVAGIDPDGSDDKVTVLLLEMTS